MFFYKVLYKYSTDLHYPTDVTIRSNCFFTIPLMGEGYILLKRGYGFMGWVYHPPSHTQKLIFRLCYEV